METIQIEIANKRFNVLYAISEEDKIQGLQNVESLEDNEGCLFDYSSNPQESLAFTMENTSIPLDIIFIDDDGEVISIKKGDPFAKEPIIEDNGPIAFVLEVKQNSGISEDDELELEDDQELSKEMHVIAPDGTIMISLEGGERIFSRKNTRILIKKAKKAFKTKNDVDYKSLGKYMFKCIHIQDTQKQEYIEK